MTGQTTGFHRLYSTCRFSRFSAPLASAAHAISFRPDVVSPRPPRLRQRCIARRPGEFGWFIASFVFDREILDGLPDRHDRRAEFIHAAVVELRQRWRLAVARSTYCMLRLVTRYRHWLRSSMLMPCSPIMTMNRLPVLAMGA